MPEQPEPKRKPRIFLVLLAFIAVVAAGFLGWKFLLAPPPAPPGVIELSGRIEGDDSAVAAKTAGRVRDIAVREGDRVEAGQTVATLDDDQVHAREQQAQAALEQSQAKVRMQQQQISIVNEQLHQSTLGVVQARADAEGRVRQADGNLAAAEAALTQAQASYKLAVFDKDAYTRLAKVGAVSERQGKQAESTEQTQAAVVEAAKKQVDAARGALTMARANLANPDIRTSQVAAVRQQILQAQSDLSAAMADASRAQAQLDEAKANRRDLNIIAPFGGVVATRTAEPGEVVAAGTPILTVVDLNKVYLRGFISEGEIGKVRLGQAARVFLDSAPQTPLDAFVSRIDPQASFTPENTYFRNDRIKQVVGVKLQVKTPGGFAKPGMPADGEVLQDGASWPAGKRRK